jgi:hypothetical protein
MSEVHRGYVWAAGHGPTATTRIWYSTRSVVFAPESDTLTLELASEEVSVLDHVLEVYLGDLRMEIVGTDNPQMRRDLRDEERLLRSLRTRLRSEAPADAPP